MGTRADFYVGRGESAEWIGSIALNGYPEGIKPFVLADQDEASYRAAVAKFFERRRDVTLPAAGWPWPWEDSGTTDFAYAWDDGRVYGSRFGHAWFIAKDGEPNPERDEDGERIDQTRIVFPKFTKDRMAPPGSDRSGIMVIRF